MQIDATPTAHEQNRTLRWLGGVGLATVVWVAAYSRLTEFADGVLALLGLSRKTAFGEALHFFFYDTPRCCCYWRASCL